MEIYKREGPILLLAGPGTGKTYCLAQRIRYLCVEKSIPPENVTVITFTNEAAKNMQERISDSTRSETYTPSEKKPKLICTMHSLGFRIIVENLERIGYTATPSVLNLDSVKKMLLEDATNILGFATEYSQETSKCRQYGKCRRSEDIKCKICDKYREILKACSVVDYDDQILLANEILRSNHVILDSYREKCLHLLIDEYQDINASQFELINLLTKDQDKGLFVVGDDDQSIYSWRGGTPKYIRKFERYFNEAQIIQLQKSYRCPEFILESALAVVKAHDDGRLDKDEFEYNNMLKGKIIIHDVASDRQEAYVVNSIIKKSIPARKVLVLVPGRRFAAMLVDVLKKTNINFYAPMGLPGYGFPIVKILSQWIQNNSNNIALRHILSILMEKEKFGVPSAKSRRPEKIDARHKAMAIISDLWNDVISKTVKDLWSSLQEARENEDLLNEFHKSLSGLLNAYKDPNNVVDFFSNSQNIFEFWDTNVAFLDEVNSWINFTDFLSGQISEPDVRIMTLQGAKGLEAEVVCIMGMENGVLPKDIENMENLPEESRLLLVSMTRAKEELHIFHARRRSGSVMFKKTYADGKRSWRPSLFIDDIPKVYLGKKFHPA